MSDWKKIFFSYSLPGQIKINVFVQNSIAKDFIYKFGQK